MELCFDQAIPRVNALDALLSRHEICECDANDDVIDVY